MGTNYYTARYCPTCGNMEKDKHLGKSSSGWTFLFQWNDGKYYKNYEEMIKWLNGRVIIDEYGCEKSIDDFMSMVEMKKNEKKCHAITHKSDTDFIIDGHSFTNCEFS